MSVRGVRNWKDVLRIGLGLVMLVLGLLGLVLPVLQGFLFLLVSVALLAPYSRTLQRVLDRAEHRHPRTFERARDFRLRLRARLGLGSRDR